MKKISTNTRLIPKPFPGPSPGTSARAGLLFLPILAALSLWLSACAFTEYGNRINGEQLEIARLEDKRHNLETQYIIVLNNLEEHPGEEKLIKERDEVRRKLIDVSSLIVEKRKLLDQSFKEWEDKIVQEKIEKEMIDREIKENEGKNEDVEFENK
jgi:hypothetical protein